MNGALASCDSMREIPEATIPVLYPRTPGVKPTREENPLNAWYEKLNLYPWGLPIGLNPTNFEKSQYCKLGLE